MAFNRCDAGSVGCRLRVLAMSDRNASLEVSMFIQRAIKLLVRSCPMISCNLTNSAMSVRARVRSSSCTLPMSCMVWRRRAWTCARISCAVSITRCLGRMTPPPQGEPPCCLLPLLEGISQEQMPPLEMLLLPQTPLPDVLLLAWPPATVRMCLVSGGRQGLRLCSSGRWTVA